MDNEVKSRNPKSGSTKGAKRIRPNNINPMNVYQQAHPPTIKVEQVMGANMGQRVLELDFVVPERKPDIEQIIDVYVKNVKVSSLDVLRDQVIVRGSVDVKVMYVADLPSQPVHAFEQRNIKFTRNIEILGTEPGMKASADAAVEFIDYDRDCAARSVHVTVVLRIWARVIDTLGIELYPGAGSLQGATLGAVAGESLEEEVDFGEIEQPIETPVELLPEEVEPLEPFEPGEPEEIEEELEEIEEVEEVEEIEEEVEEEEEEAPQAAVMKVKGRVVNVRNGPGTNFPVITQVKRGDTVIIRDQAFGWYKVTLADGTTTGWIASWLLVAPKG